MSTLNNTLTTIVVEDSDSQRTIITKLVESHPNLKLVNTFHNGIIALEYLRKTKVELILLDIEMPVIDGFEFLDFLTKPPAIVVVSDRPDHALKAFDYNVIDYVQKPVDKYRFNTAINRVLKSYGQFTSIVENKDYIYINRGLEKTKLYFAHINWIEALGDYIKIVTLKGNFLVLSTMKAFLSKMPQEQFVRIHKSYIVNINKIDNWSSTSVEVHGTEIPMSRAKKEGLEKLLIGI